MLDSNNHPRMRCDPEVFGGQLCIFRAYLLFG